MTKCHKMTVPSVWQDVAPMALLQWAEWDMQSGDAPAELQQAEFFPITINPDAPTQPAVHIAGVPAWGAVLAAHGSASDDHIKLYGEDPCIWKRRGMYCNERGNKQQL